MARSYREHALALMTSRGISARAECPFQKAEGDRSFRGLSDMDVARALSGQGWPVNAGPWNSEEPRVLFAKRKAGWQGQAFWLLFGVWKSNSPEGAKPEVRAHTEAALEHSGQSIADGVRTYGGRVGLNL